MTTKTDLQLKTDIEAELRWECIFMARHRGCAAAWAAPGVTKVIDTIAMTGF